jgi:hypothetical protein
MLPPESHTRGRTYASISALSTVPSIITRMHLSIMDLLLREIDISLLISIPTAVKKVPSQSQRPRRVGAAATAWGITRPDCSAA